MAAWFLRDLSGCRDLGRFPLLLLPGGHGRNGGPLPFQDLDLVDIRPQRQRHAAPRRVPHQQHGDGRVGTAAEQVAFEGLAGALRIGLFAADLVLDASPSQVSLPCPGVGCRWEDAAVLEGELLIVRDCSTGSSNAV